MAKQPEQRFASAQEMRLALHHLHSAAAPAAAGAAGTAGNDATVIVPPAYWARAVEAAAVPASPSRATIGAAGSSAISLGAWDPLALSRIERALASHVGPMARLMVRQAAGSCSDVVSLATAVASHIPEAARRQQFMSVATAGSQALPAGTAIAGTPAMGSGGAGSTATPARVAATVDEAFKAAALAALTRHIGPIARVVVKRSADQSGGDRGRFTALLLEAVSDADRPALQKALAALP